jgi:hypothetical protein
MDKSKLSFALPERQPDEPDMSAGQLAAIRQLAEEVEAEGLDFDLIGQFGEEQAAALIDRLTEIRDGTDSHFVYVEEEKKPGVNPVIVWTLVFAFSLLLLWLLVR